MSDSSSALNEVYSDSLDERDLQLLASPSPAFSKVFFERPSEANDKLNLARTLFDLKEYNKCAFTLAQIDSTSQSALFLKNYATYLISEQKREEQNMESGDKI